MFKEFLIFQDYFNHIIEGILGYGLKVSIAISLWYFLKLIVKKMGKILFKTLEKSRLEEKLEATVFNFLKSFFKILTDFVIVLIILPYLGVPTTSIIAVFGSLGIAIGLAAQGILSNFVSGIIVLNSKFFKCGDHIKCEDVEGLVEAVQIFFTTLKTFNEEIIKIPNSKLTSNSVVNFSANPRRRVVFSFQIPHDTNIGLLKDKIEDIVVFNNKKFNAEICSPTLIIEKYTSCYIVVQVRFFINTEAFWDFQYFIGESVKNVLLDMKIKFPICFIPFDKLC
ncbi:mechanosensitive ion channel family protein [Borreliella yangtzensis]|uniref:Small conductance mechanosensitive channel n=1 Tax=Borreliella yangtzensis TaxID=683292 RepID=A0ABR6PA77_9SPIR|nr:mechanosensitive ion channel family protein [Borreliella yangtzensis]MBB6042445.1 small conductance mechanosensitive channel [Borreliella yangtzensis]WKC73417.1 mechanosensitive ion channel family protein [Borreliella yangtzensis]WKC74334.1 mechanosensitive ion channel family protein [Borreliella yangtzensis]